jgi:hypothetical protein
MQLRHALADVNLGEFEFGGLKQPFSINGMLSG